VRELRGRRSGVSERRTAVSDVMMDADMRACIDACRACERVCRETIPYCRSKGGMHAEADHLRLMQDCVEICQTSASFMERLSPLHRFVCGACAEVCERCHEDCLRMGDDPRMAACAEACRRCAESCRHMSGHMMAA